MCGIAGYISSQHFEDELHDVIDVMFHRGPDNQQCQLIDIDDKKIGLAHLRLSILDLDPRSHQPFSIHDGRYIIIFNGEIYNYRRIREELETEGAVFRTQSDTEVFIRAYAAYGIDCVKKFSGIFTAFIFDKNAKKNYLVRDHIGIKPVYYHSDQHNNFFFASELKALFQFSGVERTISKSDICQYMNMAYMFEPRTGFENTHKVKPGSYLEIDLNGTVVENVYYETDMSKNSKPENVYSKIENAVTDQSLADVPVALLYSGGLDSSVLASFLDRQTKCLFFENDKDEIKASGFVDDQYYAREIADKLNLDMELVKARNGDPKDFLKEIDHIAYMVEEPISDYTFVASEELCRKARENGFKVVLSGMGGDEAFAGYPRHLLAKYYPWFKSFKYLLLLLMPLISLSDGFKKKVDRFKSFLSESSFNLGYIRLIGFFSSRELNTIFKDEKLQSNFENDVEQQFHQNSHLSKLKQALMIDFSSVLSHNLMVADKSSMLASVEMRVPLVEVNVYQSGVTLPTTELIKGKKQKYALQKILEKFIPSRLVSRPKAGFNPPLDEKINNIGQEEVWNILSNGHLGQYLNLDVVKSIVNDHFSGKKNNTFKIYQFLFLNAWIRTWSGNDLKNE